MRIAPVIFQKVELKSLNPFSRAVCTNVPNFSTIPDTFERKTPKAVTFEGFGCTTDAFGPRNLYDMPCASCGGKTILLRQIDSFIRDVDNKCGEDLISVLSSRKRYYKKTEKKATAQIIEYLSQNKDADLAQAVKALKSRYLTQLETAQNTILDKTNDVACRKLDDKQARRVSTFVQNAKSDIQNPGEAYFKRKDFLYRLQNYGRSLSGQNAEAFKEVLDVAKNLPTSAGSVSAFFVKYARDRSNEEIARRLVLPAMATTEHIVPKNPDWGGPDRTDNFMVMCGECNSKRSSMPYTEWVKIQPSMKYNFQKYIEEVRERIKIGELGREYATYPIEAIQTVKKQSEGQITAVSEDYVDTIKVQKGKPPRKTPSFEDRLAAAKNMRDKKLTRLNSLVEIRKTVQDDPEYRLIVEYYELRYVVEGMLRARGDIESALYNLRRGLDLNAERLRKKERFEDELKNPSLTPSARKQAKKHLSNVKKKLESMDASNLQEKASLLEMKRNEVDKKIVDFRASQEEHLALVNLPETLAKQIKELRKQTPQDTEQIRTLIQRRIEIQEKISAVRIDDQIMLAQKEYEDAELCYQNMLIGGPKNSASTSSV